MNALTPIMCTRKLSEGDKQKALLHGFAIDDHDFLSFEYFVNKKLAGIIANVSIPIVFTSQHAVNAIAETIEKYGLKLGCNDCFCMEGATKQNAIRNGFNVIGEAENSAALAAVVLSHGLKEIVFFCGNMKREELMDTLKINDVKINEYVVYHKSIIPLKIQAAYQGIVFFSPSQIDAFEVNNHLPADLPAFCIGETTGNHLNHKGQ